MTADDGPRTGRMLKRKVDPGTGRWRVVATWPVTHLGADEHGSWVGARRGTTVTRIDGSSVDRDELDAVAAHLPPEVVRAAGQTAAALVPLLRCREEPFGTASEPWLAP